MKILHISTSASRGGAAIAARRLHAALNRRNSDSRMLVVEESRKDADEKIRQTRAKADRSLSYRIKKNLEIHGPRLFYRKAKGPFSPGIFGENAKSVIAEMNPDILHLHWFQFAGFRIAELMQLPYPKIWTCHDQWPFTGGCHYSGDCEQFTATCGQCPILASKHPKDLSAHLHSLKLKLYQENNLTVISPSSWLASLARRSSLLSNCPVHHIPNGVDTEIFRPQDRKKARKRLSIPEEQICILFVSSGSKFDSRKGITFLHEALGQLSKKLKTTQNITLLTVGQKGLPISKKLPYRVKELGPINDEDSIARAYSAANIFVAPSLEDNLPNTVLEALSCGVPTLAFRIGGMADMIHHKVNGYLADEVGSEPLEQGIRWLIKKPERLETLSREARRSILSTFTLDLQVTAINQIYEATVPQT